MIEFCQITNKEAVEFLLPLHYSGRKPNAQFSFAVKVNGKIEAVVTFGEPASSTLCPSVCGKEHSSKVFELNRLCRTEDCPVFMSQLVAFAFKQLKPKNLIIIAYSDSAMFHCGYVYQALNFHFTGSTKARSDRCNANDKHARHFDGGGDRPLRKVRSSKNRYVYFNASKTMKKIYLKALTYPILPYPKTVNGSYTLGQFLQEELIEIKKES